MLDQAASTSRSSSPPFWPCAPAGAAAMATTPGLLKAFRRVVLNAVQDHQQQMGWDPLRNASSQGQPRPVKSEMAVWVGEFNRLGSSDDSDADDLGEPAALDNPSCSLG